MTTKTTIYYTTKNGHSYSTAVYWGDVELINQMRRNDRIVYAVIRKRFP